MSTTPGMSTPGMSASGMSAPPDRSLDTHPDIAELRARYDEAGEEPVAQVAEGLMCLAGLYAAASPWIVGFSGQTSLMMCNVFAGLAVTLLAVGHATTYGRTHGIAFVAPLLGAWLVASPWIVSGATATAGVMASNIAVGALVIVLGVGAMGLGMRRREPGRSRGEMRQAGRRPMR